jgi:hypothetical protein
MGKSQFKFAADRVVQDCKDRELNTFTQSNYYWAYRELFEEFDSKFDLDKFHDYIKKRI